MYIKHKGTYNMWELTRKVIAAVHYQDVAFKIPEGDLVDTDINETSLPKSIFPKLN